ncbi:PPE family protein [Mycobacterium shinjukuense]|uniref:PPE family protein n=1 Tax=Mycobacterium shinjukuense TaxID=398694 RepID=A0A7I7MK48_9MYCO|nr:PPE family protein [Mycobacterium shinjukuense]MCV6984438.1 PPE family protein [Mycobacterium shinjukuense]ORB65824.1 hypothetical protein BST45_14840 [Mycobacterium shinjukuense]BBX72177.1 PPE family protein [Mycobacterium shinjukuense]
MDFGALPPEINSGRMYAGPGSESMLAAATAWDGLAAVLDSAAVSYGTVVAGLAVESWLGPASASMAAAAAPYAAWLRSAAVQAEQAANQARKAATAFETAFAMTVPPPLIAANRSRVLALAAANTLGQYTPAIEAAHAEYAEMRAQDATAMYGYAGASAAASLLTPFTPPSQISDPAGPAAQAAAVAAATGTSAETSAQATLGQLTSIAPRALQSLASPASAASLPSEVSDLGSAASIVIPTPIGDLDILAAYIAVAATANLSLAVVNTTRPWYFFGHGAGSQAVEPSQGAAVGAGGGVFAADLSTGGGAAASAGIGRASLVGALSVPHSWTMAAPEIRLAVAALPSASPGTVPSDLGGAPAGLLSGMALASLAGRGIGSAGSGASGATPENEDQPKRKPTVVVIQQPPPTDGPTTNRQQ